MLICLASHLRPLIFFFHTGQPLVYTYEMYSSMYPGGHSDHGNTPTREKDDENVALDFAAIPYLKYKSLTDSFDYTGPKMVKM